MVLEHALLNVRAGLEADFESAFEEAKSIISTMPGFERLTLSRCVERPGTYLLLVEWETLDDHVEGFRGSPEYERWRRLLHHFYDPFPLVEHYERVLTEPMPDAGRAGEGEAESRS
ncbi:antibiotic biosynthesis monooxygenase family protein [Prescottella subtropica]|uniref:antibiotic biosynthesis monooxygenase family protein n=1 Tax=Prescottella subtropica TaxID=2545757 RepID=UPI0010F45A69|nr:antibiotic biosynthesis monooxygenase [Prescottella subtropica]